MQPLSYHKYQSLCGIVDFLDSNLELDSYSASKSYKFPRHAIWLLQGLAFTVIKQDGRWHRLYNLRRGERCQSDSSIICLASRVSWLPPVKTISPWWVFILVLIGPPAAPAPCNYPAVSWHLDQKTPSSALHSACILLLSVDQWRRDLSAYVSFLSLLFTGSEPLAIHEMSSRPN